MERALDAFLIKPISNRWRNRIVAELLARPMSPSRFAEAFSGPKLQAIARYFRELEEWDLLELTEECSGSRRGAPEKLYRAIRRVYFDTPHWEVLPYFLRQEASGVILEGLVLQASEALRAHTFTTESGGHRSCDLILLDRPAWIALIGRLDEILYWLSELEAESKARLANAREDLRFATVALLAFRSPTSSVEICGKPSTARPALPGPQGPHFLMTAQTAKAISNPCRSQILTELHKHLMSPKQFVNEVEGLDLSLTARYFRQLRDWGYLEVAEARTGGRGGSAVETIYRAIPRNHFSIAPWEALPAKSKDECPGSFVGGLITRMDQAIAADTMDSDTDRHISWQGLLLDSHGWHECTNRLNVVHAWISQLESESARRLAVSGGEEIPTTAALLAFRSPEVPSVSLAFQD